MDRARRQRRATFCERHFVTSQSTSPPSDLYAAIRAVVDPRGGIESDMRRRHSIRETPRFA
jgi:hypothetical protein